MAGPGSTSVRSYNFYFDDSVANTTYDPAAPLEFIDSTTDPDLETPFVSHSIMWSNDGAADLFFSFDGVNDHGRVRAGEALQQDYRRARRVWLRTAGAAIPTRLWAW